MPPAAGDGATRTDGFAGVAFARADGRSRLAVLDQRAPLRVLFPDPADDPLALAVIANTGGGLVGGDRLASEISVGEGAAAVITSQAAEKVYRSAGAEVELRNSLKAEPGAWLEWLPLETILFDRARLRRSLTIDAAPGARVLAGEIVVFGRIARGERFSAGFLHDAWEVRCAGVPVWADALRLDGAIPGVLADPACFGSAVASATLVYVAADAAARLAALRAILDAAGGEAVTVGATCLGPLLVARLLAADPLALRHAYGQVWAAVRAEFAGLPPRLPRTWHV